MSKEIEDFIKERNKALLSLNEENIRAFHRKWNEREMTSNPVVFWGSIHKAITGIKSFPKEFRQKSKDWLTQNGLKSLDDGDLS